MGDKLKSKSAVITGGGGVLGREIALVFAAEGANVLVVDPGCRGVGRVLTRLRPTGLWPRSRKEAAQPPKEQK